MTNSVADAHAVAANAVVVVAAEPCPACMQASQMVSQVIASTVPLPIPSALNLPMGASLEINGRTRAGECEGLRVGDMVVGVR